MKTKLILLFTAALTLGSLSSCVDPYYGGVGGGYGYGGGYRPVANYGLYNNYNRPSYVGYRSPYYGRPSYGYRPSYSGYRGGYGGYNRGFSPAGYHRGHHHGGWHR